MRCDRIGHYGRGTCHAMDVPPRPSTSVLAAEALRGVHLCGHWARASILYATRSFGEARRHRVLRLRDALDARVAGQHLDHVQHAAAVLLEPDDPGVCCIGSGDCGRSGDRSAAQPSSPLGLGLSPVTDLHPEHHPCALAEQGHPQGTDEDPGGIARSLARARIPQPLRQADRHPEPGVLRQRFGSLSRKCRAGAPGDRVPD